LNTRGFEAHRQSTPRRGSLGQQPIRAPAAPTGARERDFELWLAREPESDIWARQGGYDGAVQKFLAKNMGSRGASARGEAKPPTVETLMKALQQVELDAVEDGDVIGKKTLTGSRWKGGDCKNCREYCPSVPRIFKSLRES